MEDKKVLITGGAGAIGAALVRHLEGSNRVTVLDNLSSGDRRNLDGTGVRFVEGDVRDTEAVADALADDPEVVVHLAGHFANKNSIDHPVPDLEVNAGGTVRLLEACRDRDLRFVYASSSCVYGGASPPLHEDAGVSELHTPYAVSKYSGELYTRFYEDYYGIRAVSLRFFNNFGPFDPPGRYRNVLPNFLLRAVRGEPLVVTGTGRETRDFNYCRNTVEGIVAAATVPWDDLPTFKTFNVGSGTETTIRELAEACIEAVDSSSEIVHTERRGWDPISRRCADITRAREHLGYEPVVGFREGLERTAAWFVEQDWGETVDPRDR